METPTPDPKQKLFLFAFTPWLASVSLRRSPLLSKALDPVKRQRKKNRMATLSLLICVRAQYPFSCTAHYLLALPVAHSAVGL